MVLIARFMAQKNAVIYYYYYISACMCACVYDINGKNPKVITPMCVMTFMHTYIHTCVYAYASFLISHIIMLTFALPLAWGSDSVIFLHLDPPCLMFQPCLYITRHWLRETGTITFTLQNTGITNHCSTLLIIMP